MAFGTISIGSGPAIAHNTPAAPVADGTIYVGVSDTSQPLYLN